LCAPFSCGALYRQSAQNLKDCKKKKVRGWIVKKLSNTRQKEGGGRGKSRESEEGFNGVRQREGRGHLPSFVSSSIFLHTVKLWEHVVEDREGLQCQRMVC
jgi:hypothetical protein